MKPFYYAKKRIVECSLNTSIKEVARMFRDENIGSVVVRDDANKKVGLMTDTVVYNAIIKGVNVLDKQVKDLKLEPLVFASKDADIDEVSERFRETDSGRLAMTDSEGNIVGILKEKNIRRFSPYDMAKEIKGK